MMALAFGLSGLLTGCQQTLGPAAGTHAPAGTLSTGNHQPLIPLTPFTGATRVPPPPTGSSQVSTVEGYGGPQAAAAPAGQWHRLDAAGSFVHTTAAQTEPHRSRLGGMPVTDLTSDLATASRPHPNQPHSTVAAAPPADAASAASPAGRWQPAGFEGQPVRGGSADLAGRLQPLDSSAIATMVPAPASSDARAQSSGSLAMAQYRSDFASETAAGDVQPMAAEGDRSWVEPPSTAPLASQPASSPSQTDALLWRKPSQAR